MPVVATARTHQTHAPQQHRGGLVCVVSKCGTAGGITLSGLVSRPESTRTQPACEKVPVCNTPAGARRLMADGTTAFRRFRVVRRRWTRHSVRPVPRRNSYPRRVQVAQKAPSSLPLRVNPLGEPNKQRSPSLMETIHKARWAVAGECRCTSIGALGPTGKAELRCPATPWTNSWPRPRHRPVAY